MLPYKSNGSQQNSDFITAVNLMGHLEFEWIKKNGVI